VTTTETAASESIADMTATKTASTKMSAASTAVRACPRCRSKSYKSGDG
jgi:hypothetical protein